ncbi:hypothetical protein DFH28DRAFT_539431 [Melampsora americana]|nr:hypothetical protein DFH28DRAFT_539431 [Melampsora americana]
MIASALVTFSIILSAIAENTTHEAQPICLKLYPAGKPAIGHGKPGHIRKLAHVHLASVDSGDSPARRRSLELEEDEPAPGKEVPGKDAPGKNTPGKHAPGKHTPGKDAPGKDAPGKDAPGKDAPGKDAPGKDAPGKDAPGKDAPGKDSPGKDSPGKDSPGNGLRFKTTVPVEWINSDREGPCGPYKAETIMGACLWQGTDPIGDKPENAGWLDDSAKMCKQELSVARAGKPTQTITVKIIDTCDFKSIQPKAGCNQIYLTKMAFDALKPTPDEAENGSMNDLIWDFKEATKPAH